ncbi:MAG: VOC family protein [Paracoccaceae bacterium]|nr:VOC family protein [Paracoccaceae bacterium]
MSSPPFTVRDLGEVAIRCRDLTAMTAFYRDIVGLEVIEGGYSESIVFLKVAEGFGGHIQVVALFEAGAQEAPATGGGSSLHHLALTVRHEDLAPASAWYRDNRIATRVEPHPWIGWDSIYVSDPEGNTVELVAAIPKKA